MASKKIDLLLSGMHCTACAAIIERQLKKLSGVLTVNVNFAAEKAYIVYDPSQVNADDLIKVVEKAGYKAAYMGIISFFLATPVQFVLGSSFYKGMLSALKMRTSNMDSLVALGTSVAYFYSLVNFIKYWAFRVHSLV